MLLRVSSLPFSPLDACCHFLLFIGLRWRCDAMSRSRRQTSRRKHVRTFRLVHLFVRLDEFFSFPSVKLDGEEGPWVKIEWTIFHYIYPLLLLLFSFFSHVDPVRRTSDDHLSFLLLLRMQRCAHCTMCRRLSLSLLSFTIDIFSLSLFFSQKRERERGSEIILHTLFLLREFMYDTTFLQSLVISSSSSLLLVVWMSDPLIFNC